MVDFLPDPNFFDKSKIDPISLVAFLVMIRAKEVLEDDGGADLEGDGDYPGGGDEWNGGSSSRDSRADKGFDNMGSDEGWEENNEGSRGGGLLGLVEKGGG